MRTRDSSRTLRLALVLLGLALCVACASRSVYFGPSRLDMEPPLKLTVELLEKQWIGEGLGIRLSLTNRSADTGTYCVATPWSYSAVVDGETVGYDFISTLGGICSSEPLIITPHTAVEWETRLIFKGEPVNVTDLRIEIRVYPLNKSGRPDRKRFHEMAGHWKQR